MEEDGSKPQQKNPEQPLTRVHVRVDSKVRGTSTFSITNLLPLSFWQASLSLSLPEVGPRRQLVEARPIHCSNCKNTHVVDVEHGNAKPTGQFNYTLSVPKDIKVMPQSYQEYMVYIDARRRVKLGDIQSRQEETDSGREREQLTQEANLTE